MEMQVQSTPMRMLQTRFAELPAAGNAIDYSNTDAIDQRSMKKHYNEVRDKDVAPRLVQPGGIDIGLYNSLQE